MTGTGAQVASGYLRPGEFRTAIFRYEREGLFADHDLVRPEMACLGRRTKVEGLPSLVVFRRVRAVDRGDRARPAVGSLIRPKL